MLGWNNIFHCEINPFWRRVLEYWFTKVMYEIFKMIDKIENEHIY